mmetsp:Transcript_37477/g.77743  ORF Transcript_37477/g.77743 Transcript_37477/m.77743 type:complete len:81 (-) Transcript_37477:3876-4118(-)
MTSKSVENESASPITQTKNQSFGETGDDPLVGNHDPVDGDATCHYAKQPEWERCISSEANSPSPTKPAWPDHGSPSRQQQ